MKFKSWSLLSNKLRTNYPTKYSNSTSSKIRQNKRFNPTNSSTSRPLQTTTSSSLQKNANSQMNCRLPRPV